MRSSDLSSHFADSSNIARFVIPSLVFCSSLDLLGVFFGMGRWIYEAGEADAERSSFFFFLLFLFKSLGWILAPLNWFVVQSLC